MPGDCLSWGSLLGALGPFLTSSNGPGYKTLANLERAR